MSIMQDLHTVGLNPFAVTLLAESLLKSKLAQMSVGQPITFDFPVRREDCAAWAGVRITLQAIPAQTAQEAVAPGRAQFDRWGVLIGEVRDYLNAEAQDYHERGLDSTAQSLGCLAHGLGDMLATWLGHKEAAAPTQAAPLVALTDADIEAVLAPCEGSAFAEHLRREFIKSFKRVYFKLHPERAHGIHAQAGATTPTAQEGGAK